MKPFSRLRLARGRAFGLALVAVLVAATVVVFGVARASTTPRAQTSQPENDFSECQTQQKADCRQLRLPDGTSVRYTVFAPDPADDADQARTGSTDAVVVDLGGPGFALFGQHWPQGLRTNLGATLAHKSLILLEEPWVTAPDNSSCSTAASTWFTTIHDGGRMPSDGAAEQTAAASLLRDCGLGKGRYGWSPKTYAQAVTAIAAHEGLQVDGMIGASFGARRSLYLNQSLPWAVLVNPAPRQMSAVEYLAVRHSGALKVLTQACGCPASAAAARLVRTQAGLNRDPETVARRSVPVTAADVGAAALALPYQDDSTRERGAEALLGKTKNPSLIGALADTVWNRIGSNDVSLAAFAYLDEVCPAYPGWPDAGGAHTKDPIAEALASVHSPCSVWSTAPVSSAAASVRASKMCVAYQGDDGIAPPKFAATWGGYGQLLRSKGRNHTDISAIQDCLRALPLTDEAHPTPKIMEEGKS